MSLSTLAIRRLRALAHDLDPVVQIGKDGITPGLVDATRAALLTHELIKVKLLREAPIERHDAGSNLASACEATLAQVLGRVLVLYKQHPKQPKIDLAHEKPKRAKAGAAKASESDESAPAKSAARHSPEKATQARSKPVRRPSGRRVKPGIVAPGRAARR